jgi:alpha-amylase/alpha-mannosidase (GH57 family)
MVFRDRTLSDLISFSYGLDPEKAAADLLERLRRVGEAWTAEDLPGEPVVPLILDGENAWENYRDGGRVFLRSLYRGLSEDPGLRGVTVGEALADAAPKEIAHVFAGSWIRSDFSVWIGDADDRRAWELLADARDALDRHGPQAPPEARDRAWDAFRAASGSDWCWWYGEEHNSENDLEFDRLFRRFLKSVYLQLGVLPPDALDQTLITTHRPEVRKDPRAAGGG